MGHRPLETEEWSNRWLIHPLSDRLAAMLARAGVHPNAVSYAGMAAGVAAGAAYSRFADPAWATAGLALMVLWHILDGADGAVARLTGQATPYGKVLDGVCDYVVFAAVYLGLGYGMTGTAIFPVWLYLVGFAAGGAHALQAAALEARKDAFRARLAGAAPASQDGALLARWYAAGQRATARDNGLDGVLARIRARAQPAWDAAIADYRRAVRPQFRGWLLLSANHRTLLIFACALAGRPLIYAGAEIFAMTGWLAWMRHREAVFEARFAEQLTRRYL